MPSSRTRHRQSLRLLTRIWVILLTIFIGELLFYTWCRVQCTRIGYEISQITGYQKRIVALQNSLKIEVAHLKAPDRIAHIAKHQLGLALPRPDQVVSVP
ncbi:MAG: cell division protein FtsL [Desulfobacterales bacterium]|nr:cell division protein FtsL [Desulfobacterales bacterium]